jgi:lipopolysaccharide export system protein LptA
MKSFSVILLLGLLSAGHVLAERADRDKPVNLEADRATVDNTSRTSVFTGNVVLTQGTLIIRADKMVVKEDTSGFRHATAFGNLVSFRQKRDGRDEYIEGWSERMEYDGKADKVQLFKKARLKRGQDEVEGDYISYDAVSEFFQVTGSNEKTDTQASPAGRVRLVIQPKSKQESPATESQ